MIYFEWALTPIDAYFISGSATAITLHALVESESMAHSLAKAEKELIRAGYVLRSKRPGAILSALPAHFVTDKKLSALWLEAEQNGEAFYYKKQPIPGLLYASASF